MMTVTGTAPLAGCQHKGRAMKEPTNLQILLMALVFWAIAYPLLWVAMAIF